MSAQTLLALDYLSIYAVWGTTYLAMKILVAELSPAAALGTRFLAAAVILAIIVRWKARTEEPRPITGEEFLGAAVTALLLFCGGAGLIATSLQRLESSHVAMIAALSPLLVAALNRGLGGPALTTFQKIGGAAGVSGAILLALRGTGGDASGTLYGYLLALSGVFSWSLGLVLAKRVKLPHSPFTTAATQMLVAGSFLTALAAFNGEISPGQLFALNTETLVALAYVSVFGSVVALLSYVRLLRTEPVQKVTTHTFVNPMVAVAAGVLFGNEAFTVQVLIALALTMLGTVVSLFGDAWWKKTRFSAEVIPPCPACALCSCQ